MPPRGYGTISLKQIFLGATKFGGHCPQMPPRGYGPGCVTFVETKLLEHNIINAQVTRRVYVVPFI